MRTTKCCVLFFVFLCAFALRGARADEYFDCSEKGDVSDRWGSGEYCVMKDGPIQCILNANSDGGGISCSKPTGTVLKPSLNGFFNLRDFSGYVYRRSLAGQVCFIYDRNGGKYSNGSGISCVAQK